MRTLLAIHIVAIAAITAGCATTPFDDMAMPISKAYTEATSVDRARIRVSTDGAVRLADNTTCARWDDPNAGVGPVSPMGGPLLTKANNGKVLGIPGTAPQGLTSTELYVPSGRPLLFHYMKQQGTSMTKVAVCDGLFAFVPQAGRDYQAVFSQSPDGSRCLRGVVDIADRDTKIESMSDGKLCGR